MLRANKTSLNIDYAELSGVLAGAKNDEQLFEVIVNAPFKYKVDTSLLSLGVIVLLLVNKANKTIDRIAITDNEVAHRTKRLSAKRFEDIKIPVGYPGNIIAKAIETGKPQGVSDWQYMFVPELTPQEARFNQADGGIGFSAIYPLIGARDGGALIFSYYNSQANISRVHKKFMREYSELVAASL